MPILDCQSISTQIKAELSERVQALKAQGLTPGLAVILVGNNPASETYVRNKHKTCGTLGIYSRVITLPENISQEELLAEIQRLNEDKEIHGILVQQPLPKHIDQEAVDCAISPSKDVDCFHPFNVGLLYMGKPHFLPCTPSGVIELLKRTGIEIAGKQAVVIGRSNIVGKPMAALLLAENATVTIAHSKTKDLPSVCRQADILVVAVGIKQFVTADFVKHGAVVIDVGMNKHEGKLYGDVDFDACIGHALVTPVPKGVGPMTINMLMENCVTACEKISKGTSL